MRHFVMAVFDEYISGTTNVYTTPEYNSILGQFDQLSIEVICDRVSGHQPDLYACDRAFERRMQLEGEEWHC
jgi:hypothetical protein